MQIIDVHSHPHDVKFSGETTSVIERMRAAGVGTIAVGTYLETSEEVVRLADQHEEVWAAIGIHPNDTEEVFDTIAFGALVAHPKVVAIGECGLDYFGETTPEEKERQRDLFLEQIAFAAMHDKPLMIHCRPSKGTMDAHEVCIELLKESQKQWGTKVLGNIHFFTGTLDVALAYNAIGFTVSFPGVITFAPELEGVVQGVPLEMMHVETDSPYAAPVPYRGIRNEPVYVIKIAEKIAHIKGMTLEEVLPLLRENARRVFGI